MITNLSIETVSNKNHVTNNTNTNIDVIKLEPQKKILLFFKSTNKSLLIHDDAANERNNNNQQISNTRINIVPVVLLSTYLHSKLLKRFIN